MNENQLARNSMYYRKKRGLSQEKKTSVQAKVSMGKMPWIFIGISVACIFAYITSSVLLDIFSVGTLICMFVVCVPIQLFLHIYFSNAINNDSFTGIAGFDDRIEYNIYEVKRMLVQINLHIGIMSTVFVFLLCVINCMDLKIKWLNGLLILIYLLNFVMTVEIINYKMTDKIYCRDEEKERAKRSMPVTVVYTLLLFAGMGIAGFIFEIKGIENNTMPAMKICGLLLLGVLTATTGLIIENRKIKKWNPAKEKYKTTKASIVSLFISVVLYGLMCIV